MFFNGKSDCGWDAREEQGVFVSPDGKEWSNLPYTKEQREQDRAYRLEGRIIDEIHAYLERKDIPISKAIEEVRERCSGLSHRCRKWITTNLTCKEISKIFTGES